MSDDKGDYKLLVNEAALSEDARDNGPLSSIVAPRNITLSPSARASLPILSYCCASILMTVTNKYVVSGYDFNMNFMLLAIQASVLGDGGIGVGVRKEGDLIVAMGPIGPGRVSVITVALLWIFKFLNLIKYRDFDWDESRRWFPIAAFLVAMIYTGSKALQFLRIPIYTIFKNLTIILIAYGEVLWFGGLVTSLMLISFVLMVGFLTSNAMFCVCVFWM
ncbi:hypothetical protein BC936DRAFT_149934 [Jimgerdemannia flammicorona]|uniref:Uncharacterized protein n=1 Tax=Jimgerdemannia flammicorona TaxID=994334 RepID=A0A433DJW3_9FUNG|nr:hypothetical protein BC936DRAFT_149934 [Jimgerdemannia flammicorona]